MSGGFCCCFHVSTFFCIVCLLNVILCEVPFSVGAISSALNLEVDLFHKHNWLLKSMT